MKIHYWSFFKSFSQKANYPKWPLDDLWPRICWRLMCDSTRGSVCPTPMVIYPSMWIQWLFFKNLTKRSMNPRWPLTPLPLRSCVWFYPRIIVSKSRENMLKYVDTVTLFSKNLNQRSMTPRWPLTPSLLRSHVWLYPRVIVSKSHENSSKYVDIETLFSRTWTKGHWPLDDLWPHICWGHMCNSTQGSFQRFSRAGPRGRGREWATLGYILCLGYLATID